MLQFNNHLPSIEQRKILLEIEDKYNPADCRIYELEIDGYDMAIVAEHCNLLYQDGLVNDYQAQTVISGLFSFTVGNLTTKGYDFLDSIRDPETWEKVKLKADEEKLPKTVSVLAKIAGIFTGNVLNQLGGS